MASDAPSTGAAAKPKRGKLTFLILLVVVAALGGGGWFVYQRYGAKLFSGTKEGAESDESIKVPKAPPNMGVPVVPDKVVFVPRVRGHDMSYDTIVSTNSKAPKKLIVQLADTKKIRYAMTQVFLASTNTDELVRRVNENEPALFDILSKRLADKIAKDVLAPGFRNRIRAEFLYECNKLLGSNVVQEVIITELVTQ